MTNAEAIETLRANYPDACFGQLREAVDAAIEALKAQNVAGDTISRQAAIEALTEYGNGRAVFISVGEAVIRIENLPSAEPRGKWIYHIDDLFPAESTKECDQCHAEQPLICDDEFCPHCEAKMEVTE